MSSHISFGQLNPSSTLLTLILINIFFKRSNSIFSFRFSNFVVFDETNMEKCMKQKLVSFIILKNFLVVFFSVAPNKLLTATLKSKFVIPKSMEKPKYSFRHNCRSNGFFLFMYMNIEYIKLR